ncbi:unnamed protein product [Urochloa humidicola]
MPPGPPSRSLPIFDIALGFCLGVLPFNTRSPCCLCPTFLLLPHFTPAGGASTAPKSSSRKLKLHPALGFCCGSTHF